jgi:hypothetical protein
MAFLLRHVHNGKLRVALAVLVIVAVVVIDLVFSGNPALSIAILVVVVIVGLVRFRVLGRGWPRGSDKPR